MFWRTDPGPCIVCGAAHSACKGPDPDGVMTQVQLPARDAAAALERAGIRPPSSVPTPMPAGYVVTFETADAHSLSIVLLPSRDAAAAAAPAPPLVADVGQAAR